VVFYGMQRADFVGLPVRYTVVQSMHRQAVMCA
jgi:hypothetical protein